MSESSSSSSSSSPQPDKIKKEKFQRKVQDLSSLSDDVIGKQYNATVKSTHAFGLFATVQELGKHHHHCSSLSSSLLSSLSSLS